MNELKVFSNPDFGEVRTLEENGEVLFCGTDVAKALGYSKPHNALTAHCRCALKRGVPHPQTPDKKLEMIFIHEGDVYRLIARSKLPSAERFERWVFDEVLPSIRKHGAYMTPETLEAAMLNPHFVRKLCDQLIESQGKCKELEATNSALTVENQIMAPKASYFDQLVDRNTLTNFRETAKALNVAPKAFVSFLLEKKYIYRDKKGKLLPYENRNEGLFEVKECYNEKTKWGGTQTLVTPKGREAFRLLYVGA